jgi:hypothetical protein
MLDMRLDFENNADAMQAILPQVKNYIPALRNKNNFRSFTTQFELMREKTNNFNPHDLLKKLNEKNSELMFNIQQVINNYCQRIDQDLNLGEQIQTRDEYPVFQTKCIIDSHNNILYDNYGRFDIAVKKIGMKSFVGFNQNVSNLITMSRVATLVRARECLLNIQAYNVTDVKFDEIQKSIEDRTSALSALLQKKVERDVNLDSVPPLDCKYYTPGYKQGGMPYNSQTVFYLAYPKVVANLEELFFFNPQILQGFLDQNDYMEDDLILRLHLSLRMINALQSLHKTGIIHKNIRLGNIHYHYFEKEEYDSVTNQIYVSIGEFSMSGIDDYDARITKTFFVPDDAVTELGPMLDVYQLGIAIIQVLYMIPSEATPEMTLSKIAKMTDENARVMYNGGQVHLFERLMTDAINGCSDVSVYRSAMTNETAICSIHIFQKIYTYFVGSLWDNYSSENNELIQSMYYFRPEVDDDVNLYTLYKIPKFKSYFMSMFLSLYMITPQCYGRINLPSDLIRTIRNLIHPNVSRRLALKYAQMQIEDVMDIVRGNSFMNVKYSLYDNTKFVGKNYNSVLKRKQTQHMI